MANVTYTVVKFLATVLQDIGCRCMKYLYFEITHEPLFLHHFATQ